MQITENKRGKVTVLELDGRLDTGTSAELDKRLMSLLNSGEKYFVLDLARLTYVSSAGLRVLLMGAKKSAAAGGRMVLANLQDLVQEVFDIAGFTKIFSIYASQDEAINCF
ncbi:MAG TPA: STAS domain-containing protein [Bacillota bacterium]|jgi:anti-anti-sigma factor|nr:STAS domain-containing protein [Peptococcaceae bacterium MAG4]NLW37607.1 STAS domain-containing protein [Peptococcaceae bacterium]HPZ42564.1 STAS domain-containing protein [Bacillota bacterium]HQD76489.1 STAS domain-containing protein [Bacillota bacterium]HUM58972.1 STAS domain-containing protein [Bacillota bacterium]